MASAVLGRQFDARPGVIAGLNAGKAGRIDPACTWRRSEGLEQSMREFIGCAAQPTDGDEGKIVRETGTSGLVGIEQCEQTGSRDLDHLGITQGTYGHRARLAVERGHQRQDAARSEGRKRSGFPGEVFGDLHLPGGDHESSIRDLSLLAKQRVGGNGSGLACVQ